MRVLRGIVLCMLLLCSAAHAQEVEVARLDTVPAQADVQSVRAVANDGWIKADAIRREKEPGWWRLQLAPASVVSSDWVLAIKETYDAELVAYLPPDYRALRISGFDSQRRQLGSRHRLALTLPEQYALQPVYLHVLDGRHQPMRVSAAPLLDYVAEDLARVRYTSMILSALFLLGLVATIFSVALRRWHLLFFAFWVLTAAIYVMVMTGELVAFVRDADLLRHSMRLLSLSINVGMFAVYFFIIRFLAIAEHYPRVARLMYAILIGSVGVLGLLMVEPASRLGNEMNNLAVVALAILSLAAAVGRARAGSMQGWFYLVGWGCLSIAGMARAGYFLRQHGTPDWLEVLHPAAQVFGALVLVLATARAARYAERELHVARSVAHTDPLTRLPNRSRLDRDLGELMRQAEQGGQPLCVLFLDIDHFKAINDRYGHAVGDRCLVMVGNLLRRHVRASDLIVRYGGEEFVLALDGAGGERGIAAAENLRAAVQEHGKDIDGHAIGLTVSIGLADCRAGDRVETLLARADAALYRAKREGRNRVVVDVL